MIGLRARPATTRSSATLRATTRSTAGRASTPSCTAAPGRLRVRRRALGSPAAGDRRPRRPRAGRRRRRARHADRRRERHRIRRARRRLRGDDGPNDLRSAGGKDDLQGNGGDDELHGEGTLDGGDGDDLVAGGYTSDTLRGGEGDDRLVGLGGADLMEGGAGDDLLNSSEQLGERATDIDDLRCGSGRDRVAEPDIYDRASSCERIAIGGGLVVSSASLRRRSTPLRVEVSVLWRAPQTGDGVGRRTHIQPEHPGEPRARRPPPDRAHPLHPGAKGRLRRSKVIAFGTKDPPPAPGCASDDRTASGHRLRHEGPRLGVRVG